MLPPIKSAAPNKSAVTGSGTGAGAGSLGLFGGGLKAWSGSCFGQPQLSKAAITESPRIKRFGRIFDACLDALQWKWEMKSRIVFLMDIPSFD